MAVNVFFEIGIILVIAALITGLIRILKQPVIIGYIITGLLVSPYFLNVARSTDTIQLFSQIGVALLLFIVGLNLTPKVIKEFGLISLITGVGQVIFTSVIGYIISVALGFSMIESLYIAVALTFSSTIIIMKLLSDKKDLETLYGKISIGFLLVQDFIAIFILIAISTLSNSEGANYLALRLILKGILVFIILTFISKYLLPNLSNFFAKSQEYLFLFSIAWGFGLAMLFQYLGFSIEIGALVAGITLSISIYNQEISSKMKPLRDFFMILFFIFLGSQMAFGSINNLIYPALIFSLFILIGNPLIVIILMGLFGYSKRIGFLVGLTVAQISEFSLILIALGVKVGHLSPEILTLVTIVGLVTIAGSTYLIIYSEKIYPYLSRYLSLFERKSLKKEKKIGKKYDMILFGYNRIGYDFVKTFQRLKKRFLVVDFNPDTISKLINMKVDCKYGDADDSEFLDELNLSSIRMAVSTIPHAETNLLLISKIRKVNKRAIIIVVSHDIDEANILYNKGATYVLMPHFLGGRYISTIIDKHGLNLNKFIEEKKKQMRHLKERKDIGHEHPKTDAARY
ncbi:cation:proton antiporter [Candidatus Woesearchaeota archaeon]|nr:cation:proton antiporter [Candidatus Woesearchaeota archaeon]